MKQNKANAKNAGDKRKEKILKIATRLFADKGYHNATLDEIARKLKITRAALYYYVPGKGQIIHEIMERCMARMNKAISLGDSNLPPKEQLRQFIIYHIEFSAESADESKILFEQTQALPKAFRAEVQNKKRAVNNSLQNILRQGVKEGVFAIKDIKTTSFGILGLCNWTYHWYKPSGKLTPQEIAELFIDMLEKGYLKK